MTALGWIHTATALAALMTGAVVLLVPKGTARHRQFGWIYVANMLALNVTALLIYRLFGRFGPFHVAAVLSLIAVVLGTTSGIRTRRYRATRQLGALSRAAHFHYAWMTWSYVGLAGAAVAETATRVPFFRPRPGQGLAFGLAVAVSALLVFAVGARLIRTRRAELLAPYQPPPRGSAAVPG